MLHPSTFGYLLPTEEQKATMEQAREAAKVYADVLEHLLPDGPDKTFVIRAHRANAMWANVAITREADGSPRAPVNDLDPVGTAIQQDANQTKS